MASLRSPIRRIGGLLYSWVRLNQIREWCKGTEAGRWADISVQSLCTDSRLLKAGDVFLALKGDSFDGHNFVETAVKLGAAAVVTERPYPVSVPCLVVKNTLHALVELGRALRDEFTGPVFAITGSAGKSSTKEMLATLLGPHTVASPASFNNLMGVSRTLCLVKDDTRQLILEMGMNHLQEIDELCESFRPIAGLITNIGDAHIGKLGGKQGVYQAKKELFDYLARPGSGTIGVALNIDDGLIEKAYQEAFRTPVPVVTYSCEGKEASVKLTSRKLHPDTGALTLTLEVHGEEYSFALPLFGLHQGQNVVAAIAAALVLGRPFEEFRERVNSIRAASHRGEVKPLKDNRVLLDESYNSNPTALRSSLESLAELNPLRRRVLVIGEMFELGEFSERLHGEVGTFLADLLKKRGSPFILAGVGKNITPLLEPVRKAFPKVTVQAFSSHQEATPWVQSQLQSGDVLFVKGSRGVELDKLVARLE